MRDLHADQALSSPDEVWREGLSHLGDGADGNKQRAHGGDEGAFWRIGPINAQMASKAVLRTLSKHVTHGEIERVKAILPENIRKLWPLTVAWRHWR